MQYNSAIGGAFANLRLRFKTRAGRDLYLVYNAGMNTDRYRIHPVRPLVTDQAVLIKYSHALDLGF